MTNTKAIELLRTPTFECTGVKAISKDEGTIVLHAKAGVAIAMGGFHANREIVTKYMGGVCWMPLRGSAYMMGENIELTRPFQPYYTNLDQFLGGLIHGPTQANPSTMVNYSIIVDTAGMRILDEVMTYVAVAKKLPLVTKDNWAFIIIDQQVGRHRNGRDAHRTLQEGEGADLYGRDDRRTRQGDGRERKDAHSDG